MKELLVMMKNNREIMLNRVEIAGDKQFNVSKFEEYIHNSNEARKTFREYSTTKDYRMW